VNVENDPPLGRGKTAEVSEVRIAARLDAKPRRRCAGQIHGHVQRRPPVERKRQGHHATVAERDQLGYSPVVGFFDQSERVRSVVRCAPDGVGAPWTLFPHGLAARDEFGP
jgi:hypothetical protein